MKILALHLENLKDYAEGLCRLEAKITYPLGDDRFRIDHGESYLSFFARLGKPRFFIAVENEQVVGVGGAVLREIPQRGRLWYLCDLKVDPNSRGQKTSFKLFKAAFLRSIFHYLRTPRGYAISMNPGDGSPNRVVKLMERFSFVDFKTVGQLHFYSLDESSARICQDLLSKSFGPVGFLSVKDQKDIILQSSNISLPLLHFQWGPLGKRELSCPLPDAVHMFCLLSDHPLQADLKRLGFKPSATATLVGHRVSPDWDWSFILTSDI